MDPQVLWLVAAIAAVLVIALIASTMMRKRRSAHLREQFGPEYERTLRESKNRTHAERDLAMREREASQLPLRAISSSDGARLHREFERIEKSFVERPALALAEADELVSEALRLRGFPLTSDFDGRAKLVSVHHPRVIDDYREAHRLRTTDAPGKINTEEMRQALLRYRNVLSEIVSGGGDREQMIAREQEVSRSMPRNDTPVGRRSTDDRVDDRRR